MMWSNLRLEESIMGRLMDYRRRLESDIARKPGQYPEELRGKRLSLGEAVNQLLLTQERRSARSNEYRARRLARRRDSRLEAQDLTAEADNVDEPSAPGAPPEEDVAVTLC